MFVFNKFLNRLAAGLLVCLTISSCVSKKEFAKMESMRDELSAEVSSLEKDLGNCNTVVAGLRGDVQAKDQAIESKDVAIADLNGRIKELREENKEYFNRIGDLMNNKDMATAEFLDMIRKKDEELAEARDVADRLNYKIQVKDSMNLALVLNLRKSLENINDEDISIEVRGEVVYVSISDKLLFRSGSARVNAEAAGVLSKVAGILNEHDHIDIMVEGHTDSVSISTECVKDNWDLSVARSAAVVRTLQEKYAVDPARLTASGRSYYMPKASNDSKEGRSQNRRTEIIITPRLDQFLELHQIDAADFEDREEGSEEDTGAADGNDGEGAE